jgi:hypothetical protein
MIVLLPFVIIYILSVMRLPQFVTFPFFDIIFSGEASSWTISSCAPQLRTAPAPEHTARQQTAASGSAGRSFLRKIGPLSGF